MEKVVSSFTVFFEEPFWVGVYERSCGSKLEVCKITFGPEPKDYTVYEFLQRHGNELRFSPPVKADRKSLRASEERMNPKRRQRFIQKQLQCSGTGTKAQQALALQREELKTERKSHSRQEKELEDQRQFRLRQEKKKQKHRGR